MFALLAVGYGILGLRIEVLLLISAAFTGLIAYKLGYNWDDIINAIVEKLAKAMPVILILVSVGGLIASWMVSGTIPYMVYWGLKSSALNIFLLPLSLLLASFPFVLVHLGGLQVLLVLRSWGLQQVLTFR